MKHLPFLPLILSGFLCIPVSCRFDPKPPLEQAKSFSKTTSIAYGREESKYAAIWFDHHKNLVNNISGELNGREYTLPPVLNQRPDTFAIAGGKWKIFVKGGKEVHAFAGSAGPSDKILYNEKDTAFTVALRNSTSGKYIFIEACSGQCSESYLLSTSSQTLAPMLIQERKAGIFYKADHFGGNDLWILTNEHAPNHCIMIAPVNAPGPGRWKAAVRENDSVLIDDYSVIDQKYLVLVQRKHLMTSVEITGLYSDNKNEPSLENKINFPEPEGHISDLYYESKDDKIVFRYTSLITPPTCYAYGLHSMHLGIRWKKQIRNYIQDDYKVQTIQAVGKDHSKFPLSLIRKRNPESGNDKKFILLYIDQLTSAGENYRFSTAILSLLDRGLTIACLHLPENLPGETGASDLITSAINALIEGKHATPGMVSVAACKQAARAAWYAITANPSWYMALVLDSPAFPEIPGALNVPMIYLLTDTLMSDAYHSLSLAASIRKMPGKGNIFLLGSRNDSSWPPEKDARFVTFILASYRINQ